MASRTVSAVRDTPKLLSRIVLSGSGVLAMRGSDFLLAAFPRSGSTWTRHVLCNLISLSEWDGRDVEPVLNDTMPALGANNLFAPWTHPTIPRVIKTHLRYSPLFKGVPSIGIIRDPRDVMVSRYHLLLDTRKEPIQPFSRFIRDPRQGLVDWFGHFVSWRSRWRSVFRYEDMLRDPEREFNRLLDALGARCPDGMLLGAIERSSFTSLQRAEMRRKPTTPGQGLFFRSGTSGQWREYFDDEDLAFYQRLAADHRLSLYGADEP